MNSQGKSVLLSELQEVSPKAFPLVSGLPISRFPFHPDVKFYMLLIVIFISVVLFMYLFLLFAPFGGQLPEPLTGKTWTLDDFEPYPALLVITHLFSCDILSCFGLVLLCVILH